MKLFKLTLILFGMFFTPVVILAQQKNRLTLQTGLFHSYFDGSPLMNTNFPNNAKPPFTGLLINSVGIQYKRTINNKNAICVDFDSFHESYDKHFSTYPTQEPVVGSRSWVTVRINYCRAHSLTDHFDFVYGGGVNSGPVLRQ